ncbi:MAG: hypothetical protein M3P23_06965 [Actinomycetota bacterium]|nr:hypothetical protein [Actinomycetota bacterium]
MSTGTYAVLVGPDGAGKSTVSRGLVERARTEGIPVTTAHYRPGFLAGRSAGSTETTAPHVQQRRGMAAGIAKLLLLTADGLLGYLFLWRGPRRSGLLIVERGWWDMAVDPRRYRLHPRLTGLVEILGRLLPRADIAVLLSGDAQTMDRRKTEIGAQEVERQVNSWQRLARHAGRRVVTVDTTAGTPDETVHCVWKALSAKR